MATWDLSTTTHHILLCNGSSCNKAGAEEVTQAIRNEIALQDLDDIIHTTRTRCNGRCEDKCVVVVYPQAAWYKDIKPEDAPKFIDSLISGVDCLGKVSHQYNGKGFSRTESTPVGLTKNKEKVKKVSKTL